MAARKLSPVQQGVIDSLKSNQRLLCVDHTATGPFAGKLYNATLSQYKGRVHTTTLKALIANNVLTEKSRDIWQRGESWTMYKVEYVLG